MFRLQRVTMLAAIMVGCVMTGFAPGFAPGFAMAQQTIIDDAATPIDLTQLVAPENTAIDSADTSAGTEEEETSPASIAPTGGLRAQNPAAIRLAALGVDLHPGGGFDRMLWQGSEAGRILGLYRRLPGHIPSVHLRRDMVRLALMRSLPPQGSIEMADALAMARLNWLAGQTDGTELAGLVRQLPDDAPWQGWAEWLVLHDLLQRNDEAACQQAKQRITDTLEVLWHQINAFCMTLEHNHDAAGFALDILEDRGVDAPIYFAVMRHLTGAGEVPGQALGQIIDQNGATPLDIVLLDSGRIDITMAALKPLKRYAASFGNLRYLDDEAAALMAGRAFHNGFVTAEEALAAWGAVPEDPANTVSATEALTQFSFAHDADTIALGRYQTWQALRSEEDKAAAAQLAMEALKVDFGHRGAESLPLWVPIIMDGIAGVETPGAEIQGAETPGTETLGAGIPAGAGILPGILPGLVADFAHDGQSEEALAWAEILAFAPSPLPAQTLATASALDAAPVLMAAGREIETLDWGAHFDASPPLVVAATPLPLARLQAIKAAADAGLRGETLMLVVITLGEMPLHRLGRDDAGQIITALRRAGLEETARGLAAEILRNWALARYLGVRYLGDMTDMRDKDAPVS